MNEQPPTSSEMPKHQITDESLKTSTSSTFDDSDNFSASKSPASECLYVIGGDYEIVLSSVSKLDSRTNKWTVSTPMPCPRKSFGCAVIGRKIYICGGHDGQRFMNALTVYDTDTEQWTQLKPMKYARDTCSMAVLDGFLYVAGGFDGREQLSVVERYSVENDHWETITPMITKRFGLELVSFNGFLYAIGGFDGSNLSRSVERYSLQTKKWKAVASLKNEYLWLSSAVFNNRLYVAGGNPSRDSFEVYHPEKDEWNNMLVENKPCGTIKLGVFNGKLLAIGIFDPFVISSRKIGRFDFGTNTWIPEADMNVDRLRFGVAVVKNC